MNLQTLIANEIKNIYDFHEYSISKEKVIELSKLIIKAMPNITEQHIKDFSEKVKSGEFGVMYKMPTSIMSMFQNYIHSNKIITNSKNEEEFKVIPGWTYR